MSPVKLAIAVRIGFESLRSNPLRSMLATLGVIIGVGALVSVLALADGVEAFSRAQIAGTTDLLDITIRPRTTRTVDGVQLSLEEVVQLTPADAEAAATLDSALAEVNLVATAGTPVAVGSAIRAATVVGTLAPPTNLWFALSRGRYFTAAEASAGARVAVVSASLAVVVGADSVSLGSTTFTVVGVVDGPATAPLQAYVPLTVLEYAVPKAAIPVRPFLVLHASRIEAVTALGERVQSWTKARWGDEAVAVVTNAQRVRQASQAMTIFKLLMGAIAGISLVVGGIGIMNVLLATVTERTREIGVRKATGARQGDVLLQFLSESVAVCGLGSVLGLALGYGVAHLAAYVMRSQTGAAVRPGFVWSTPAIAAGAAIAVGLTFGLYPALRAARLSVVDAIRHE
jgi:putative ABC transport system permease protein